MIEPDERTAERRATAEPAGRRRCTRPRSRESRRVPPDPRVSLDRPHELRADREPRARSGVESRRPRDARRPARFTSSCPATRRRRCWRCRSWPRSFGVGAVLLKDERERLGLPSFKGLGASWATLLGSGRSTSALPSWPPTSRASGGALEQSPGSRRSPAPRTATTVARSRTWPPCSGWPSRVFVPQGIAQAARGRDRGRGGGGGGVRRHLRRGHPTCRGAGRRPPHRGERHVLARLRGGPAAGDRRVCHSLRGARPPARRPRGGPRAGPDRCRRVRGGRGRLPARAGRERAPGWWASSPRTPPA